MSFFQILNIGAERWRNHIALALFTAVGCFVAHLYAPYSDWTYALTLGFGYLCVIFLALSLLIGPVKLLSQRRNPVNIDLRRDVGIWSAITGCLHVFYALQVRLNGQIWAFFLELAPGGYRLRRDLFGFSNDVGLVATIFLIVLLVISNDLSLRRLKGRRWKVWQRFNYLLAALALLHTLIFQIINHRQMPFMTATLALTVIVLAGQAVGFYLYRARRHRRMRSPERA